MKLISPPLCDIDPAHGPMQAEPVYKDGKLDTRFGNGHYWYCRIKDCDGYGGPCPKKVRKQKKLGQMELPLQGGD